LDPCPNPFITNFLQSAFKVVSQLHSSIPSEIAWLFELVQSRFLLILIGTVRFRPVAMISARINWS